MSRHRIKILCPEIPLSRAGALCPRAKIQIPSRTAGAPGVGRLIAAHRGRCTAEPAADGQWAALAHDLRACLNAIVLSTETTRACIRSGQRVDLGLLLSRIERNARMILDLIDSPGVRGQPQPAERGLSIAAVRLDELAHETTDAMLPIAEEAGIHVNLHADAAVSVHGDRIRLRRVISNLLANAIRHAPKDSSIDVVVNRHESTAVCHVADRGPGVPAGDRRRIFGEHFQGSGMPGAAGLGLFICREIVEEHGGRIWVEDHVPHGARFVFTLPLEGRAPNLQPEETIRFPVGTRLASDIGAARRWLGGDDVDRGDRRRPAQ